MNSDKLKYGIAGLVIGGAAMWFFAVFAVNSSNTGMMGVRTNTQNMMQSEKIDAHFIEQMIPHHEDAITMAKLAQTKAQKPEVKQLARDIIDSQQKEINQMKKWYRGWFGNEVATGADVHSMHGMMGSAKQNSMHMGMMGDVTDITRLENAEDFDRAFVEEMIPHHQMAVMMASMLRNGTQRPEMKNLADDIISVQTFEIDQMREWLTQWR